MGGRFYGPAIASLEHEMTQPISSTTAATSTTPAANTPDAAAMDKFEGLIAQRMMMQMQQGQQAMNKSMTKMTDAIKQSMQDEE